MYPSVPTRYQKKQNIQDSAVDQKYKVSGTLPEKIIQKKILITKFLKEAFLLLERSQRSEVFFYFRQKAPNVTSVI